MAYYRKPREVLRSHAANNLRTSSGLKGGGIRLSSLGMVTLRMGETSRSPSATSQWSHALIPRTWACWVVSFRP